MVGDSVDDADAAAANGVRFIAATYGYGSPLDMNPLRPRRSTASATCRKLALPASTEPARRHIFHRDRSAKPLLSVVTSCYNEEDNVRRCTRRCAGSWRSTRNTGTARLHRQQLTGPARAGSCANVAGGPQREGHPQRAKLRAVRSGNHVLLQTRGVACSGWPVTPGSAGICCTSSSGAGTGPKIILGVKRRPPEWSLFYGIRAGTPAARADSDAPPVVQSTGFGMLDAPHRTPAADHDPYPSSGVSFGIGYETGARRGTTSRRARGITSQNSIRSTTGLLGITSHSKVRSEPQS